MLFRTLRVHLSAVVLLRDQFREENVEELLEQAAGKSKREVEELVARLAPKPDVASSIRKLLERATAPAPTSLPMVAPALQAPARTAPAQVSPVSDSRYTVQLTASTSLRDKLEHARDLMRHRNPTGDLATVVEEAVDLLIAKLEKEKFGKTSRPRKSKAPADPGHITQATRCEVAERDGCQCSYVSPDAIRCTARAFLE
jgi:hypothetical protein